MFLDIFNLCSCFRVRHPYKTTGKFTLLCIFVSTFWIKDGKIELNGMKQSSSLFCSLFLREYNWFVIIDLTYLNFVTFLCIYCLSLSYFLAFWWRDMDTYIVSSGFNSRPLIV
jgi:hypothetical protein